MDIKNKFNREITEISKQCSQAKRTLLRFNQFLEYIDNHQSRAIKKKDIHKIVSLHQTGYTYELERVINESEKYIADIPKSILDLDHYTIYTLAEIEKHRVQIEILHTRLINMRNVIYDDVDVLKRNVSVWFRLSAARNDRKG